MKDSRAKCVPLKKGAHFLSDASLLQKAVKNLFYLYIVRGISIAKKMGLGYNKNILYS